VGNPLNQIAPSRIVFCDFDGTITEEETFVALLKKFTPVLSAKLMPQMYSRKLTLREGVRQLLESIPSNCYEEMVTFAQTKKMRSGFPEFLTFLAQNQVPFVLVSGGVRIVVEIVIGELAQQIAGIYAVDLDRSGEYLKPIALYEDGNELVAKVKVMEEYPCDESIAIGDSITDLNMALHADVVFARDRLALYLDECGEAYLPWQDFNDIREYLARAWSETEEI
jgi:2-hydroxy-3-keto-5-methylthiopentenyl-1-phosphate phosphatase